MFNKSFLVILSSIFLTTELRVFFIEHSPGMKLARIMGIAIIVFAAIAVIVRKLLIWKARKKLREVIEIVGTSFCVIIILGNYYDISDAQKDFKCKISKYGKAKELSEIKNSIKEAEAFNDEILYMIKYFNIIFTAKYPDSKDLVNNVLQFREPLK